MKWTLDDILVGFVARLTQEELERLAKFMGDSKFGPVFGPLEREQTVRAVRAGMSINDIREKLGRKRSGRIADFRVLGARTVIT
jgi:hypothetical protein